MVGEVLKPGDRVRLFRTYDPDTKVIFRSLRDVMIEIGTIVCVDDPMCDSPSYKVLFDDLPGYPPLWAAGTMLKKVD
jgi:hypothetical protein